MCTKCKQFFVELVGTFITYANDDIMLIYSMQECHNVPEEVCTQIHKNVPQQHECEVCGGVEKSCRKLDTKYTKYEN